MKIGFVEDAAQPYVGTVHVCDIGLPGPLFREVGESPTR
jgi:hypothetical protein